MPSTTNIKKYYIATQQNIQIKIPEIYQYMKKQLWQHYKISRLKYRKFSYARKTNQVTLQNIQIKIPEIFWYMQNQSYGYSNVTDNFDGFILTRFCMIFNS